jgi:hypothetical protein
MEESSLEELIPELDLEFLKEKNYTFEIIPLDGNIHLILKNFHFPELYSPNIADLLIILPSGYPNAALDMFRTFPDVKLTNGTWPNAASPHEVLNGKNWQSWSRHIVWRAGRDNLRSFVTAIKKELEKGL